MKQKSPHEVIVNERKRHAMKMEEIYDEYGITRVIELINEIESKMEKTGEMNKEFREELIPLFCEMTEGERTTIKKRFTLRENKLYKYSSSNTIKPREFITKSGRGKYIMKDKKKVTEEHKPNPFYYLLNNISDYGISNKTGNKLEQLIRDIKKNRKELKSPLRAFKPPVPNEYGHKVGETISFDGGNIYSGTSAVIEQTEDLDLLYVFKRAHKQRNHRVLFFEDSVVDNGEILIDGNDFVFGINQENIEHEKLFLEDEERIRSSINLLEKSLSYVEHIMETHEALLDSIEKKFAAERVSRDL